MLSGIALAAKALRPSITVLAAEPCGACGDAADVAASKQLGRLVTDGPRPDTIADGLQGECTLLLRSQQHIRGRMHPSRAAGGAG